MVQPIMKRHRNSAYFIQDVENRSGPEDDLDVHAIRHLNTHELSEGALVRVEVYQPLVDAHLPPVAGARAASVRALPARNHEPLGRQRDGTRYRNASLLADRLDLLANPVHLLGGRAAQRYPAPLHHLQNLIKQNIKE